MPPEIIKLLRLDALLDTVQIQKSATPVATPTSVEEAAADLDTLKPNCLVSEKNSQDALGIHAQRHASLHDRLEQV